MSWDSLENGPVETGEIWVDPNGDLIHGDDMETFFKKGSGWLQDGINTVGSLLKNKSKSADSVPMSAPNPLILYQDRPNSDPGNQRPDNKPNWGLISGIAAGAMAFVMILILALKK